VIVLTFVERHLLISIARANGMTLQLTLDFLRELAQNNNKAWFDENRTRYQAGRDAFERLVTELILHFEEIDDLSGVTAKDCMYRINRDVRFSKDKSPYNMHMSAVLARGGRKPQGRSYYLQIQPDNESLIGGGLYAPTPKELDNVRQHIVENARPLRRVIEAPLFVKHFGALQGDTLKTAPSGYDKTHPAIDLLRHKQFMATHVISDEVVTGGDLVAHIVEVCQAMKPFVSYFQDATH